MSGLSFHCFLPWLRPFEVSSGASAIKHFTTVIFIFIFILKTTLFHCSIVACAVNMITIIDQIALNKSSVLLKIQKQNTHTLQLFTEIIKTDKYLQKLLK